MYLPTLYIILSNDLCIFNGIQGNYCSLEYEYIHSVYDIPLIFDNAYAHKTFLVIIILRAQV